MCGLNIFQKGRRKMKRVLVSMLALSVVEGLAARASAEAEAEIWYPPNVNAASDNILLTASAVTVFEIQDDAGPTYIVCLEPATQTSYKMTDRVTYTTIANSLPEPTTIAMLGLCGFMLGRRKTTPR
jgi:hypothetical protein